MTPLSRRRLLAGTVVVSLGLAGCSGGGSDASEGGSDDGADQAPTGEDGGPSGDDDGPTESGASADGAASASQSTTTTTPVAAEATTVTGDTTASEDLDLREANVVDVTVDGDGNSRRFSVTLYHDDDGEDGYADWWQVERLDGERLGRRTLLHAHSTAPFTRSETITVPAGTTHVVVRGHDQTHGYGGRAMVVNVASGATEAVDQGPEPRDLSGYEPGV